MGTTIFCASILVSPFPSIMEQYDYSRTIYGPSGAKVGASMVSIRALGDHACGSGPLLQQASQEGLSLGYRPGRCPFAILLCRGHLRVSLLSQPTPFVGRHGNGSRSRYPGTGDGLLESFAPRASVLCNRIRLAPIRHRQVRRGTTGSMVCRVCEIIGVSHHYRCHMVARAALQMLMQLPVRTGLAPAARTLTGIHGSPSHDRRGP
jgi:hypothetical protein